MERSAMAVALIGCMSLVASVCVADEPQKIVDEGGIGAKWTLADGASIVAPGYPQPFVDRGDNVCVALGYTVNADGTTSDFTLLKTWNSASGTEEPVPGFWDAFGRASVGAVSQWRFKPKGEDITPQPVFTVATLSFYGKHRLDPAELRGHCAIGDLTGFVQQVGWRQLQDNNRVLRDMERQRAQQAAANAQTANPGRLRPRRPDEGG